jgi:hypothetical protein
MREDNEIRYVRHFLENIRKSCLVCVWFRAGGRSGTACKAPCGRAVMVPTIRALTEEETYALDEALDLIASLAGASPPILSNQLEEIYNRLLFSDERDEVETIALGVGLGEELRWHGDYEWVRVSDDFGDETCLAVRGFELWCCPISMIQKRLKRNEAPDFVELREAIINTLAEQVAGRNLAKRDPLIES